MKLLEGKTAIITGASRGIGRGIAEVFAAHGANIAFSYSSSAKAAKELEEKLSAQGVKVKGYQSDASNFAQSQEFVDAVVAEFGGVDILVNNAGITKDNLLMRISEEDFDKVIEVNLKSVFNMTKAVQRFMLKQRKGSIINMSSVVGVKGNAGQSNYAASKAGMIGLTKSLAREVASRGITVNAIAPGFIETDMTDQLSDRVKEAMLGQIPLKRFGQVEHIAKTVDFLIDNDYITGQVIEVNGGLHI